MMEKRTVRPAHPGEILEGTLEELGISQTAFAQHIGVSRRRINEIINGQRGITPDTAIRIARALGSTARLWLNLQHNVDAWDAMNAQDKEYKKIRPISKKTAA